MLFDCEALWQAECFYCSCMRTQFLLGCASGNKAIEFLTAQSSIKQTGLSMYSL